MEQETILIVDDHEDTRESLWMLVQLAGHEPIAVGTAEEGLRVVEATPKICAIILDPRGLQTHVDNEVR